MKTFEGRQIKIYYNSDLSGDCVIISKRFNDKMHVPCEDLINFVNNTKKLEDTGLLNIKRIEELLQVNYCSDNSDDKYIEKTGRSINLLVTNIKQKNINKFRKILKQFPELEIVDDAYDCIGNKLNNMKAIIFKNEFNIIILRNFWNYYNSL